MTEPASVTLAYSELRALLHPVVPHACTDDMLPSICTVAVAASGRYLVAQATDRFTAAFKRVQPAVAPPADFGVLLQAPDAKRMLNLLRPSRGTDPVITLTVDAGRVRVATDSGGLALGMVGLDLAFARPILGSDPGKGFPDIASILPKPAELETAMSAGGFNLAYLSRFRTALEVSGLSQRDWVVAVHMGQTANKPMVVAVEDDFIGVIMPRRALTAHGVNDPGVIVRDTLSAWQGTIPRNGVRPPAEPPAPVLDQSEPTPEPIGADA